MILVVGKVAIKFDYNKKHTQLTCVTEKYLAPDTIVQEECLVEI